MNAPNGNGHWRLDTDADGIAWLALDRQGEATNVLSRSVLEELENHLAALAEDRPTGLVFLSAKPNGFLAGADITEFTRIRTEREALELIRRGQDVMTRIASLPFPTLAMIHGFCVGGGLELALACDYRVARDDPSTRLGLPEVRLGIHPGFGGTVRLPPLVGGIQALDLILSGRTLDARRARRIGLVDHAVPERHLRAAARHLILHRPPRHRPDWRGRLSNWAPVRPLVASLSRRRLAARVSARHYPAPYAALDLWRRLADRPAAMMQAEAASVARLVTGESSRNLVRAFFLNERMKGLGKADRFEGRHVHLVGAGVMGGDIAAWCALRGFFVTLQDQSPERIAPALQRAHRLFQRRLRVPRRVQEAMDRLLPDPEAAFVHRADLVIEAIFEDREAKQALYRELEPRMKPEAILATNTSSIPLQELAPALARPERLVGLHFFNPVAKMQLVEIVCGPDTAEETQALARAFTRRIDRLPLPVSSSPGFLVNRVLMPYLLEAVELESEGVPAPAIDRAATDFGMPMGPIELADTVGLDVCLHVARILGEELGTEVPERLQRLVEQGHLGRKSGAGFYHYRKGRPVKPRQRAVTATDLQDRMILRLLNEAVACLREGVVADADLLDGGMIFGTGFAPFRGGPMHYITQRGAEPLRLRLQELTRSYGSRFTPDPGWETLIAGQNRQEEETPGAH